MPVGLFGLQTKISLVRGVIAAAIAARSWVSSRSGTRTDSTAARSARVGYASKERHAYITSAPGSPTASRSCCVTPTEPHPTATCAAAVRRTAPRSPAIRAGAPLSGYWLTDRAASAITSTTEGSGANGDSLDESLCDLPVELTGVRPGWYAGKSSSTARKRGDGLMPPVWHLPADNALALLGQGAAACA